MQRVRSLNFLPEHGEGVVDEGAAVACIEREYALIPLRAESRDSVNALKGHIDWPLMRDEPPVTAALISKAAARIVHLLECGGRNPIEERVAGPQRDFVRLTDDEVREVGASGSFP